MSEIVLNTDDMPGGGCAASWLLHAAVDLRELDDYTSGRVNLIKHIADQIQQQTRPPKPEEPTGLGAVVEDAEGEHWTRWSRDKWPNVAPWRLESREADHRKYGAINAVRVLSAGWSE